MSEIFSAPNIKELLDEYAEESAIFGLPHPKAKVDLYKQLESVGFLYPIGAFCEDGLVGFILVLTHILTHYSERVSTTESFFVAKAYRKTGAGIKLLRAAEGYAKEIKSLGLLISTPIGGDLAEVLSKTDYRETNRVFFRAFNGQ